MQEAGNFKTHLIAPYKIDLNGDTNPSLIAYISSSLQTDTFHFASRL